MQDMRHIDVEMHMGDRSSPTCEQHGVFFYKTRHHVFGPCEIIDQLGSMIEYIEKKYPPSGRASANHIDIFAKCFVVVCLIDRGIGIAFYIVVKRHSLVSDEALKILPIPFSISRPAFREIFYHNGDP